MDMSDKVVAAEGADELERDREQLRAESRSYGTAYGIFNFVGMSSSILAPTIAGVISDATGSLAANFYISAAVLLVGMAGMMFLKEKSGAKA